MLRIALLVPTIFLLCPTAIADDGWDEAVASQARPMHLEGGSLRPAGPGGEFLVRSAADAELVMLGENHGTVEIAELARGLYRAASDEGGRVLVTEIGPATAWAVEDLVRRGYYERYLAWRMNLMSVPFFNMEAEAPLLHQAVDQVDQPFAAIWGLDQEFMAGAPIVARRLRRLAGDGDTLSAVWDLYFARWYNPMLIGMGDGKELQELRDAFSRSDDPAAWRTTEQLVLSHRIYQEQMGGDADWSNRRREQLMWENFQHYLGTQQFLQETDEGGETTVGPPGRFFFKFGSYHLFRGEGPTVDEPLGLRASRWADAQEYGHLNLMVDCAGGETLEPLFAGQEPCQAYLRGPADAFTAHLADAPFTVFDLRPLRDHPALAEQHERVQRVVAGYDILVLAREVTASRYLDGRLITYWYGGGAILVALLVLVALVWIGLHLWRGRRRRATAG